MNLKRASELAVLTGLFSGYSPIAPGTAGTAVAAVFLWFFPLPSWILAATCCVLFVVGARLADRYRDYFTQVDSSKIVVDEIVGMLLTMIGIPLSGYWLIVGFLAFRFFDIVKLPPANYFDQKVKNGWGVMLDDAVAGIYGNLLLHLMVRASI